MFKAIIILLFIIPIRISAQILPWEGSDLNYRIIGFSFPADQKAEKYTIEISRNNYNTKDSFAKNSRQLVTSKTNKVIAEVPAFGCQYTWRVIYSSKKRIIKKSPLYHFSTKMNRRVDTNYLRLRILHPAEAYKDDYVALDGGGQIYDMAGHAVWYVPDTNGYGGYVADMQFTPEGTITFINKNAYEINFNGDILWEAPRHDTVTGDTTADVYHHEFKKLSNGHYMVLGEQFVMAKQGTGEDSNTILLTRDKSLNNGYKRARWGTIIEYDEKGNVVWSWQTSKYLLGSDFVYYRGLDSNIRFDAHDNAFYFDEKNKVIYLGFRNLNRIIKIAYPGGNVLETYGENFKPGGKSIGDDLFCNQHSINRSKSGNLYIFDNNSCHNTDSLPTIMMLQEPVSENGDLKKVWEYTCTEEGKHERKFPSGGDAIELPDGSLFVCMGSDYSKLFIVTRDKKILWSALPESYVPNDDLWRCTRQYRANIINRNELERLIWNAEK